MEKGSNLDELGPVGLSTELTNLFSSELFSLGRKEIYIWSKKGCRLAAKVIFLSNCTKNGIRLACPAKPHNVLSHIIGSLEVIYVR